MTADEELIDGETPRTFIERFFVELEGPWTWHGGGDEVSVVPASGVTGATVSLVADDMPVRVIDSRRVGGAKYERLACPSFLEIDGSLSIATEDGALDGQWQVIAVHALGAEQSIDVQVDFATGTNAGFFEASLVSDAWESSRLIIHAISDAQGIYAEILQLASSEDEITEGEIHAAEGIAVKLASVRSP